MNSLLSKFLIIIYSQCIVTFVICFSGAQFSITVYQIQLVGELCELTGQTVTIHITLLGCGVCVHVHVCELECGVCTAAA